MPSPQRDRVMLMVLQALLRIMHIVIRLLVSKALTVWPSEAHPALQMKGCLAGGGSDTLPPSHELGPACAAKTMGELLYAFDADTSSSANGMGNYASVLFYFAVGREGETFLMAQTRAQIFEKHLAVFDVAFSGNSGESKLLFVDDVKDVDSWVNTPHGCVGESCSSWRLSFEWDGKDDLGMALVFGPLPSHGYCVSIRAAEIVADVALATFVPDDNPDGTLAS